MAAVKTVGKQHPDRLIVAVPVGSAETCREMEQFADEVVCLEMPEPFYAVGMAYDDFGQTSDEEVLDLLARAREWSGVAHPATQSATQPTAQPAPQSGSNVAHSPHP